MIVNYIEGGWEVITQRSHGLLAAQICAHWRKDEHPARWVETLIATAEHDDVYNELENEDLLNDTGGPINFKHTRFDEEKSDLLIKMAETKSAFIALLSLNHIRFVHGKDPSAKAFIKKMLKKEKSWLTCAQIKKEEVAKAYELMEFCDAFSLLICQGLIQPEQRKIQISNGPAGEPYEMYARENKLIVEPWPFDLSYFDISYESRVIPQLSFKNTAEFRSAFLKAKAVTQHLTISDK